MRIENRLKLLLLLLVVMMPVITPLGGAIFASGPKYSHVQVIKPSAVILSYIDSSGNEFEPSVFYYYGDWNDPIATYVIWGGKTDSGVYNGHEWEEYREEIYGLWLHRLKVKYLFSDIPSGYDAYFVHLHYSDRTNGENLVVTWDGSVIDSSWYPKKTWPGYDYEIDYDVQAFVVYQDYTSYHEVIDFWRNDLTVSVPMVYACDY